MGPSVKFVSRINGSFSKKVIILSEKNPKRGGREEWESREDSLRKKYDQVTRAQLLPKYATEKGHKNPNCPNRQPICSFKPTLCIVCCHSGRMQNCPPPQTYFQSIGKCIFFTPPEGPARSGDGSSMAPSLSLPGKKCKPKSIRNGTNRVALIKSNPHDILSCKCHVFRHDNCMRYCLNMKVIC